jgi:hypothetical protein
MMLTESFRRWWVPLRVLLLAAGTCAARPSDAAANTIIGIGADSCGTWTADRNNRNQVITDTQWVLGYVAGMGFLSGKDLLSGLDYGAVVSWVNNYCEAHPLEQVADAAIALGIELARRHGVIIERRG